MLRRAENVTVSYKSGIFGGKGWLTLRVGRKEYRLSKISEAEFSARSQQQIQQPVPVARVESRAYWQFRNAFYWDNDGLRADQIYALLVTRQQREAARVERAQAAVAMGGAPRPPSPRGSIPDDVKQFVWNRDGGRCRHCGAVHELQFDHVIPVAMGGSSAPENLQVLCGPCNRSKAAGLTVRRG